VVIFQVTYIRSIIVTFALKDNLFNSVLISGRDSDNIVKAIREENSYFSVDKYLYRQILEKLNYTSISMRLDILFTVEFLRRYVEKLTE
jgi:type III secretory pathway component EscV